MDPTSTSDATTNLGIHIRATKTFAGTRALDGVEVRFRPGRIHGVLGENGAGKSTLFKILAGYHEPDAGSTLTVDGADQKLPLTSRAAAQLGFAFVHQDLALAETLTVMENVCVGGMRTGRLWRIRWREQAAIVRKLLQEFGVDVSPRREIRTLSQAEKAVVAIARAAYARGQGHARLLVLDEPTANLTAAERDRLFEAMRRAASGGTAVVFCTHRLDEVMTITDEVTVLRDGRVVAHKATTEVADEAELVRHILGRELDAFYPERPAHAGREVVLRVDGLCGGQVDGASFEVHAGEVLGVTGFAGAGHDELASLIIGGRPVRAGRVTVAGTSAERLTPKLASQLGIGFLPADRKRHGGLPIATIRENMTLVSTSRFTRFGRIDHRAERRYVREVMERYDVRPRGHTERPLASLSGGNQQKVLLAKWLTKPGLRCMVLHEPTQGVDVGAKRAILGFVTGLAEEGIAVVLISSEHEELSHLCDRVLVMRNGQVRAELVAPDATRIAEQCFVA